MDPLILHLFPDVIRPAPSPYPLHQDVAFANHVKGLEAKGKPVVR